MAPLIYAVIASLDGYVADRDGTFDWAAPDEEVHAFVNDLERPVGTHLYGRRMYEIMRFWEDASLENDDSPAMRDFARIWKAASKVVYSTTLADVPTERTRLERHFDAPSIQALKDSADRPIGIGGPTLASHALAAGLVDEIHLITAPVLVGGGTPAFLGAVRLDLTLIDHRRFRGGFTYLHYSTRAATVNGRRSRG